MATFESDGHAREPAGGEYVHRGRVAGALRAAVLERRGIALEHGAVIDDGRVCALEYHLVRWIR